MTAKNKIKLVDCTLRDGGYYNNWEFKKDLINQYLKVMDDIKVDYVEIGFRFIDKIKTKGPCAYSEENFLKSLNIPKNLKIGIMINAADFVNSKDIISLAKKNFTPKKNSLISLIRIACHHNEIESTLPLINWLKKSGYKVGVNIMQIPELSFKDIKNSVLYIKKAKADILYFADSLGSLDADKTAKIIKKIRLYWKGPMGIHTHDNMGKALENSISAIKNSVEWIDSTVAGMGRGPGNTKTEYAILEFKKQKSGNDKLVNLLKLVKDYFDPIKEKYKWGSNPFYYYAGLNSIHPTFVQEMLGANLFDTEDIYSNLTYLSTVGGKRYSKELISLGNKLYKDINKGSWQPNKVIKNKDVLIIGPGNSIFLNKKKIIKFIKKYKPIVLVLNAINPIPKKYIFAHIVCHTLRLLSDIDKYKKFNKYLITPYSSFSKNIKSKIKSKNVLDFGLQVKNKKFKFEKKYVVLPNSLAISYALGISTSGEAKKIYLAGLDGYNDSSPKKYEMDDLFQNYKLEDKAKNIISLTPTNYKINIMKKI
tara:strand:+ start:2933 stop:4540 length:1608 start_codon:yes stop_codon:yes gene_type:complete